MKKVKYFGLLLAFILIMTGCGTSKTESSNENKTEVANVSLEEAIKNTTDSKDMKFVLTGEFGMEAMGESSNASLTGTGETANGNSHIKFDIEEKSVGQSEKGTYELYLIEKDGKYQIYTSEEANKWTLSTEEKPSTEINADIILNNLKDSKEVTSDKEGNTKYEAKIDLIKLLSSQLGEEAVEAIPQDITFEQSVYVYVKGKYVSSIELDPSDLIKKGLEIFLNANQNGESGYSNLNIKCNIKIEMKDYGKVKNVIVPETVVKNAKAE